MKNRKRLAHDIMRTSAFVHDVTDTDCQRENVSLAAIMGKLAHKST